MTETPFFYPPLFWIFPLALVFVALGWAVARSIGAAIFLGVVGLMAGWLAHGALLHPQMEKWLEGQRVYAILFKDFPQDKEHFVSEYTSAYETGGAQALAQKREEMKIIMFLHHIPHYIERAHTDTLQKYIHAHAWLIGILSKKDPNLCNQYLQNTKYFANVWNAVGSEVFLASVRDYPEMIVEATDSPEQATQADQVRGAVLTTQLAKAVGPTSLETSHLCDLEYRQYYLLSQMPARDGALTLKYLLGENHLKSPEKGLLQMLLPF